jgi:DNA-binding NarL/FixJ family response regulator
MIRVVIVDDHAVVRRGLAELFALADDIEVVGVASDGAQGVEMVERTAPDVVLMDLQMPVLDGVAATRRIVASKPQVNVVILTSFSEQERILDAIESGARGYLLKDAEPDELLRGVRAAATGDAPFSPQAARALLDAHKRRESRAALTPREEEVLVLVARGLANKAIARQLGISEATVKTHLTSVFATLGVTDRTQAALWAQRNGLVR